MSVYLHHLETVVPELSHSQERVGGIMAAGLDDRKLERLTARVYRQSGIDKRHSVIRDFGQSGPDNIFFEPDGTFKRLSTKTRNDLYTEEATRLYVCAARRALAHTSFAPEDVTHVVTVSCTGFFAPGPDYRIVRELGLNPATERYHVGFMGCYAAFPALRMAQAFCEVDPEAVVLVVSVELCTLHLRPPTDVASIIATSVFADGGAAAVVSAAPPTDKALKLESFASTLTDTGEADMAWTIGDEGFNMVLSTYVPQILEANMGAVVDPFLAAASLDRADVAHWAVHPGGRAILDEVESALELTPDRLEASRQVLKNYGNMSSATVLFVLKEVLAGVAAGEHVDATAFGPGLTVESGLFSVV
ncbi:type III polyketide synthase [soil metagenome]